MTVNKLQRVVFPNPKRDFKGKRWLKISLRTLHLIGVAGVGGGVLLNVDFASWSTYLQLTLITGAVYLALELWTNGIFIIQLRGLSILLKFILLYGLYLYPDSGKIILLIIILSSVISHAPGNVRYFSIFHGRRIDSLD